MATSGNVVSPPITGDNQLDSWSFQMTEEMRRMLATLSTIDADHLALIVAAIEGNKQIYIQDTQPDVTDRSYMWIQTNYNDDGDFTIWINDC